LLLLLQRHQQQQHHCRGLGDGTRDKLGMTESPVALPEAFPTFFPFAQTPLLPETMTGAAAVAFPRFGFRNAARFQQYCRLQVQVEVLHH